MSRTKSMFIMASAALLSTLAESTEADRAVTQHFVGGNMKEAKSGDVDFKRPVALKTKRVDIKPISQSGLGDQVVPFIYKAFARDEPMCQASGLGQGSPADQDQNFNGFIEYGSTLGLVAVDEATGNPLAFLTGALVKKGDAADDGGEEEKSLEWSRVEGYFGNARYDPANFATTMPGCEVTYDLEMIAVSSEARGEGLGREMADAAEAYAKSLGAQCVYLLATGFYSGSIFRGLGYETEHTTPYNKVVPDDNERANIKDPRHTSAATLYKILETR